jgi:beta-lactamase superfamily II metal-dependent hydrolase
VVSLNGSNYGVPPQANEIEVSLFGPGYGECVLLHLGFSDWVIVDSCLNKDKSPPVLEYLLALGQDPAQVVKLVVATHWHDDHIGGLGLLFKECRSARFACSGALKGQEFLTLVKAASINSMMKTSGVKEFSDIVEILEKRTTSHSGLGSPTLASANKILWMRHKINDQSFPAEIRSLSPSDAAVTRTQFEIASLLPKVHEPKKRVSPRSPNHSAVALWVTAGDSRILLGSDLEESIDPETGWTAILDPAVRPQGKASVFKVAHHGSDTAHNPRIWADLLELNPHAALTPFIRGRIVLPTPQDSSRICGYTPNAFITADLKVKQVKGRPNTVEKTIRETVRSIRELPSSSGIIQLRKNALDADVHNWSVRLFPPAASLWSA